MLRSVRADRAVIGRNQSDKADLPETDKTGRIRMKMLKGEAVLIASLTRRHDAKERQLRGGPF